MTTNTYTDARMAFRCTIVGYGPRMSTGSQLQPHGPPDCEIGMWDAMKEAASSGRVIAINPHDSTTMGVDWGNEASFYAGRMRQKFSEKGWSFRRISIDEKVGPITHSQYIFQGIKSNEGLWVMIHLITMENRITFLAMGSIDLNGREEEFASGGLWDAMQKAAKSDTEINVWVSEDDPSYFDENWGNKASFLPQGDMYSKFEKWDWKFRRMLKGLSWIAHVFQGMGDNEGLWTSVLVMKEGKNVKHINTCGLPKGQEEKIASSSPHAR